MSLTFEGGPLSGSPSPHLNYEIEGPAHKLYFRPFPRRVRIEVAGHELVDTSEGMLLYETGILPVFYAPESDIEQSLLTASEHSTHCPFKGNASYRHFSAGETRIENLLWHYPDPIEGAEYLRGYAAPYRAKVDWYDEDERIYWHLRDPYQRVDARQSSRPVRVLAGEVVIAETTRPVVLCETGLPNRLYIPREDVLAELRPSDKRTQCPYKGDASWHSLKLDDRLIEDAAWSYAEPFDGVQKIAGMLCFRHDELTTELDGAPLA